jgi:hypothetical protein
MLDRRACRKTSAYTIRDTRLLAFDVLDELATASLRDVDPAMSDHTTVPVMETRLLGRPSLSQGERG